MSLIRVLYQMTRADFLERARRYSFLIMLGLIVYLGYTVNAGIIKLNLDQYRGVFNSAWVGSMMALVANFFIGWFGFYLVKGSVSRDYETGVGQIMATTPMSRPAYMLGKWLSNFTVLSLMVGIMALAGLTLQLIQREDPVINIWALVSPLVFMALPFMALVAAAAVLFDTISWLRGGFGNVVYFFLFAMTIPVFISSSLGEQYPALEPLGLTLFSQDMGAAALAAFPDYGGGFSLGDTGEATVGTFVWPGINWTAEILLQRLALIAVAILIVLITALLFDRFDTSKTRKQKSKAAVDTDEVLPVVAARPAAPPSLSPVKAGFGFHSVLIAELKLMLKGLPWWWYLGALILMAVALFTDASIVRQYVLMFTWIWPMLIWSNMGVRESRFATHQMVFSAASPLWRQLPATWLAGVMVTALTGGPAGVRLLIGGDWVGVAMWLAAVIFIPTFALACGVWGGTSKVFEVLYVVIWYLGPLNHVTQLDFLGATANPQPLVWVLVAVVLLVAAWVGRGRQLQV